MIALYFESEAVLKFYNLEARSALFAKTKSIFRERNILLFGNYNM